MRAVLLLLLSSITGSLASQEAVVADEVGNVAPERDKQEEALTLIDREVSELEGLIALKKRKVELLGSMRQHVMSGKSLPPGFGADSPLDELLGRVGTFAPRGSASSSTSSLDEEGGGGISSMSSEDLLMLRAHLHYNSTVIVAAVMMSFKTRVVGGAGAAKKGGGGGRQPGGGAGDTFLNLLACGDSEGSLLFLDPDGGFLLHAMARGEYAPSEPPKNAAANSAGDGDAKEGGGGKGGGEVVTLLAFDGGNTLNDQPLLSVGTSKGTLSVLNVTVWRDSAVVAGRRLKVKKSPDTGEALAGQALPEEPVVRSSNTGLGLVVKVEGTVRVSELKKQASANEAETQKRKQQRAAAKEAAKPKDGGGGGKTKKQQQHSEKAVAVEVGAQGESVEEGGSKEAATAASDDVAVAVAHEEVAEEEVAEGEEEEEGPAPSLTALFAFTARVSSEDASKDGSGGSGQGGQGPTSRRLVVVGDSSGALYSVDASSEGLLVVVRNASMAREGDFARDIKRQGSMLAVAETSGTSFLSSTKFSFSALSYCKGGATAAVSLAYDVLSPNLLYAAFASGEVILYNTKAKASERGGGGGGGGMSCVKMFKLPHTGAALMAKSPSSTSLGSEGGGVEPFNAGNFVKVSALKGYVVVAPPGGGSVLLFNATDVREKGIKFLSKTAAPASAAPLATEDANNGGASQVSKAAAVVSPVAVTLTGSGAHSKVPEILIALASLASPPARGGGSTLTVFEAILPYTQPAGQDVSWLRGPMLMGGIALVFGYQFLKNKNGGGGGGLFGGRGGRRGGGRGGRSGGGGGMEDDLAAMMAGAGAGGGGGGGGGFRGGGGGGGLGRGFDASSMGGGSPPGRRGY